MTVFFDGESYCLDGRCSSYTMLVITWGAGIQYGQLYYRYRNSAIRQGGRHAQPRTCGILSL